MCEGGIQDACIVTSQSTSEVLNGLVTPVEEINYVECKEELVINQHVLESDSMESMNENMELNHAVLCKPNCCAGSLVMETGPADGVAVDCSEGASASNIHDSNVPVTICCINWTPCYEYTIDSEEETDIRKAFVLSQKQVTLQNNDISVNEEEIFRDLKAFTIDDDEASHSTSLFGDCASHRRDINYSNYSYKARTVENSEIATVHNEGDGDDKPHNYQLTMPFPSSSKNFIQKNTNVVNVHKFEQKGTGYIKPIYPIFIGNSVQVCPTNLFASLPQHDTFLVEERLHDPTTGFTKSKLVLKSCSTEAKHNYTSGGMSYNHPIVTCNNDNNHDDDDDDDDDDVISVHYKCNYNSPHCITHTQSYIIINVKIVNQPKEINVYLALQHNILPLMAILIGKKYKHHHDKFCLYLVSKVDYDKTKILSAKDFDHHYQNCLKELITSEKGFNNIKFVLAKSLEVLTYLHSNGYVHRDVKASNIMIKMRCHCRPLECSCSSRFQVKLGDFDSAGTVPGLGITEPTDQMIKFASILPLGTPGYRAPEIVVHIALSGPYETLYTTAVDMWFFGCLCLNVCIGKTAALSQREETSLLLSRTCTEQWEKIVTINELKKIKPFSYETELMRLVGCLLQDFLPGNTSL